MPYFSQRDEIHFLNEKHNLFPLINATIQTAIKHGQDIETTGNNNYSVIIPVNTNKPELGKIILTSREESLILGNNLSISALQRKNWNKTIQYYSIFVNWKITNRGTFMYGQPRPRSHAVVGTVTATIDCDSMAPYNCATNKTVSRIDPSVVQIKGRADYTNLIGRLAGHTDHGYLDVEVNGTGDVKITHANFNNWDPIYGQY